VRIRDLVAEDYDALVALWKAAALPYRPRGRDSRERIAREVDSDSSVFLAAERDGELVGVVLGTHDGRKGWINRLAVLPEHRAEGIGRALADAVEQRLREQGIEIVTCLIEGSNEGSMAFFERIGYLRHPDIHYYSKRQSPDT
jgi:ribosomal protein S18 acetylase RimI-like enzyme